MRNLKKLLALIVAVTTILTFTVPAFAADATTAAKTDAQVVTDLGVVLGSGSGVTADYLASQPDRVQGAIMFLRLKGLEATAKAFTGTDNFSDVSKLSATNKAILAYLKANPDLGFIGIGGGKYDPLAKMTAKQYYKIMLMALGYTYSDTDATADFNYNTIMSKAVAAGLTKLVDNEKFTVNDLAIGTVEALKANVKGGTKTLVAQMAEANADFSAKAATSGIYTPAAVALAVLSATTDNLKVVKIAFNKELNTDTVTTTNVSATDLADVKWSADKKTVYAIFSGIAQNASRDITIKGVKDSAGNEIAKTVKSVTFVDTTIPVISGAVAKNAKKIVLSANEPINYNKTSYQVLNSIKIDGVATVATSTVDYTDNTITLDLSSKLTAGTHKVDISDLTDYAGYKAVTASYNVDVAADTTAPSIVSATMKNINSVEVIFNEDIDAGAQGTFKINGTTVTLATQDSTNKAKFTLDPSGTLDISAIVEVKVAYKDQADVVGNKVSTEQTYTFKVADDTTLPTVTAAIASDNKITLTFSKAMDPSVGSIVIKKASDSSNISTPAWAFKNSDNNVIEIAASTASLASVDPTDIKVNLKNFKDYTVRHNELGEQNLALKTNDTKAPTVDNLAVIKDETGTDDDTITFYFSEPMDTATLNNLSNYKVDSGVASTGALSLTSQNASVKEIAADAKSITIKWPGCGGTAPHFTVYALKDVAGNMLTTNSSVVGGTATALSVSGAKATASNKIEVTFNTKIGSFDPSVFMVETTSNTPTAVFASYALDDTGTKVTLTSVQDLGTSTSGIRLDYNNWDLAKNVFGGTFTTTASPISITDAVAPTATLSTSGSSIVITFSEAVNATDDAGFSNAVIVRKAADGALIDITSGSAIQYYHKNGTSASATDFDKAVITAVEGGIAASTEYTVEILARSIVDEATTPNAVAALAKTSVTTGTN